MKYSAYQPGVVSQISHELRIPLTGTLEKFKFRCLII